MKLSEFITFCNGKKRPSTEGVIPVYGGNGILDYTSESNQENGVIIGRVGAYCGSVFYENQKHWVSDNAISAINKNNSDIVFIYYLLKTLNLNKRHIGTSQPLLTQEILNGIDIDLPPLPVQRAIAEVLSSLDDKIDLLTRQNATLEALAQTYFRQWFVEEASDDWEIGKAEDYFEIGIGKTPPRQEHHWFSSNSDNSDNVVWVSIADMGKSGLFIGDSSEYLTKEAVEQFNIRRVPKGAILLSFKLTVGRLAITLCELTTNEAIAHFKYKNDYEKEYLYCYLKAFDYYSLGSTSSIATAVNSQIIKAMPFVMPETVTLKKYHELTAPFFTKIENNTRQIHILQKLRDTLLPKLISGEVSIKQ